MVKNFIAIGSFDGVHLGHRHLFSVLKDLAAEHKMKPLLLVFNIPPKVVMDASHGVLTTLEEKKTLLKKSGMTRVEFLDFKKIKALSKERFFEVLLKKYNMGGILCGKDFAFGKDRGGKIDFIKFYKESLFGERCYIRKLFVFGSGRGESFLLFDKKGFKGRRYRGR